MTSPKSRKSKAAAVEQETFGLLLLSVRLSLIRRGERLLAGNGFDINFTQFRVLRVLSRFESISATELARSVEHDGGALTRLIDRLQEKGLVDRRPNQKDRRAIEVFMTDAGKAVWESMQSCVAQVNTEALSALDAAERTQLVGFLHRIRDRLDERAAE